MIQNKEILPYRTTSLCPECKAIIPAEVFEEKNKVMIKKKCREHGEFLDVYWEDADLFKKAASYAYEEDLPDNPFITERPECPFSCGLCSVHQGKTALLNIVLTNRCNLSCWYCFFYAQKAGYVYEPDIKTIREMIRKSQAQNQPVGLKAVQLTGGEPTIRDDLVEIVKMIKKEGVSHIQLNTNGIRLSKDKKLVAKLRKAGLNILYLSFDGIDIKTNPKNFNEISSLIENCREVGLGVVLVPTIIKTVNEHQVGDIIKFAFDNIDIVRGVNFQPVSLVGQMSKNNRKKFRITTAGVINKIEKQLKGEIAKEDFYPVPIVAPISKFVEVLTGNPQFVLTTHFACGMATYIFNDNGKMVPISRFINIDNFLDLIKKKIEELKYTRFKKMELLKNVLDLRKIIKRKNVPKGLSVEKMMYNVFIKHDYSSLGEFHKKSLFIGLMHFQDLYNYDIERVKKCQIHYSSPDGRLIPFCTFNVFPDVYRDKIQQEYGLSIEEWEKQTGKKIKDDLKV